MGEWQALRPTVSLRCRSTEVSNGFGPGTSRRCRARVFYRRGRGCFAGVVAGCATGVPAGCATGVPAGFAAGVPAGCAPVFLLAAPPVFRAPSGPPARSPSAPRASLGASARSPARPRPRWRSPHWWRVVCGERPGCGPAGALHTGGSWSVVSGQAAAPPALSTPAVHGVHARYSIRSTSTCAFALPNRCARHQFRMQFPCDYFKV